MRDIWRICPYPADPASFADFLHQIAVGKLDPHRPPWVFHQKTPVRVTANPASFDEAFRRIGRKQIDIASSAAAIEELLFCGNLGSGIIFLARRIRPADQGDTLPGASGCAVGSHVVEVEVRGICSDADFATIERLAHAADTRPVVVRRFTPHRTDAQDKSRSAFEALQAGR